MLPVIFFFLLVITLLNYVLLCQYAHQVFNRGYSKFFAIIAFLLLDTVFYQAKLILQMNFFGYL
jgi:hypothetical protein